MNRRFFPGVLVCVFALVACESSNEPPKKPVGWHPPKPIDQPTDPNQEQPGPPSEQPKEEPKPPNPVPPPTDQKPAGELPYAKPVPGKPGFVTSPYDPYKGYIDVRGFPPGTEVKDPYSGKTFLVPPF